jgi:hypothetical protein
MIDRGFTDTELKAFRDAFPMVDLDGGGTFVYADRTRNATVALALIVNK